MKREVSSFATDAKCEILRVPLVNVILSKIPAQVVTRKPTRIPEGIHRAAMVTSSGFSIISRSDGQLSPWSLRRIDNP
jgi:hypothetical protein